MLKIPALTHAQRDRLLWFLCGLNSQDAGARANDAQRAHELLRSWGLTWGDIIVASDGHQNVKHDHDWKPLAEQVVDSLLATQWERNFAQDLLDKWVSRPWLFERQQCLRESIKNVRGRAHENLRK